MDTSTPTLGTALRHLLTLLDGDLEQLYAEDGLGYRPRYTPIVKALGALGPASIRQIAAHAHMTHSAVSQSVAQMKQGGWVVGDRGEDARESIIVAAPKLTRALPLLERRWAATNAAAAALDAELSTSLSACVAEAIAALERTRFRTRIEETTA